MAAAINGQSFYVNFQDDADAQKAYLYIREEANKVEVNGEVSEVLESSLPSFH